MLRLYALSFLFATISYAILPSVVLGAYYGLDDEARDQQQQLAANQEALARLQNYILSNQPYEV